MLSVFALFAIAGCDESPRSVELRVTNEGLNGGCELVFDQAVRALSVTPRSVVVTTPQGEALDVHFDVSGARVALHLVVGPKLLAEAPTEVLVTVLGGTSVHAVTYQSGHRAQGATGLMWALGRGPQGGSTLRSQRRDSPEFVALDVSSSDGASVARVTVSGVIDPTSLDASERAWVPTLGDDLDLDLLPVGPLVWRVVGEMTEVDVSIPAVAPSTRLQFDPRRVRWMDVLGRRLQAALPVDIEIDSGFSDPHRPR